MEEKTKNILSLNHKEAMDFFLKSEQYHGFELPEYFVFDELLQNVKDSLKDEKEKSTIINLVYSKLCNQPNSDYNQLWFQNITYLQDKENGASPYKMRLCRVVAWDKNVKLWNNEWVKPKLLAGLHIDEVVNPETLKKVTPVITFRETRIHNEYQIILNKG